MQTKFAAFGAAYKTWETNQQLNQDHAQWNNDNITLIQQNTYKNEAYKNTLKAASSTQGGDYVTKRESIRNLPGLDETTKNRLETYYKAFYRTEKLQSWNSALGAKPPYGDFDAAYYKTQPCRSNNWNNTSSTVVHCCCR
jgi:hypothetical protein